MSATSGVRGLLRAAGVLLCACAAGLLVPAPGNAQAGATFSVSPAALELRQAGVAEVRVDGAPEATGYRFDLGWDPTVVVVTSVAPGEFLSTSGEIEFTPHFTSEGVLQVTATLPGAPAAGAYPSGSGTLAYVTFAPLGASSSAAVTLSDAALVGVGGQDLPVASTTGSQLAVMEPAAQAEQTAAVAQATELASELGESSGGASGGAAGGLLGLGITPGLPRLGSTAIWLGLLAVAVLVVVVSWTVGRRPPAGGPR